MSNDIYGRIVTMTTDGTYDYYEVGGAYNFRFAAGTDLTVVYLAFAVQGKLIALQAAIKDLTIAAYDVETRVAFLAMYLAAQAAGNLPNRMIYINQVFTWVNSVSSYGAAFMNSVRAQTDPAVIAAMNWDFSQVIANPAITLAGAAAIGN